MHITIAGNIGAGKTTLAKRLSDHYGWKVLFEAVDGNPYLPPFYDDMKRWAFHLQIYFLNSRFEQVLKIKSDADATYIQDRSIYEDCYIFAKNLFQSGLLDHTDYQTYLAFFSTIMKAVSPPDLMIYLKADLPKLTHQIIKRGREYENNIDLGYLKSLNELYTQFAGEYTHGKLLIIDVNNLDYAENQADFEHIVRLIEAQVNVGRQLEIGE
jgi:deoxyadenosine/deoxycytidine kinase